MSIKKCLTIGISNSCGGAGIQADIKTFSAHSAFSAAVITAVAAGNTEKTLSVFNIPVKEVENQLDAVLGDMEFDGVKIGFLPSAEVTELVAKKVSEYKPSVVVCDTVMEDEEGNVIVDDAAVSAMVEKIFPLSTIITPNITEAKKFTGIEIENEKEMDAAASKLHEMGAAAVLIKGGHLAKGATDVLSNEGNVSRVKAFKVNSPNTRGAGSALASAICVNILMGLSMGAAVFKAKDYVTTAIRDSFPVGKGSSPINYFFKTWEKQNG